MSALKAAKVAPYLRNVIASYFSKRSLQVGDDLRVVSCGVPQGSKLGPTLWNIAFDGVLRLRYPAGVEAIGYADDLAIIVTAKQLNSVCAKAEKATNMVARWLRKQGLELAPEKTELLLMTGKSQNMAASILVEGHPVQAQSAVKYLGVWLDKGRIFIVHARKAAAKAQKTAMELARITRNVGGPRASRQR